jgi:malonyl-CoA O-methyltransferase
MQVLTAQEGYRLWAPSYARETAISLIEDRLVTGLTPPLAGLRLLDAGCGIGRRMQDAGAEAVIGIDASREMLDAGIGADRSLPGLRTMVGDVRDLPLTDACVDVTWCRLVLGHLPAIDQAYRELARVTAAGGSVIVSDFHAAAHDAGHRRTFRDDDGVHEVEHYRHPLEAHVAAARAAGLTPTASREGVVGAEVEALYRQAGREALYGEHRGLPVVLAMAFRCGS